MELAENAQCAQDEGGEEELAAVAPHQAAEGGGEEKEGEREGEIGCVEGKQLELRV